MEYELCFGEGPARFVLSYSDDNAADVAHMATEHGVSLLEIGTVDTRELCVSIGGSARLELSLDSMGLPSMRRLRRFRRPVVQAQCRARLC